MALVAVVVLAAGCGGSPKTASTQSGPLAFASCMRSHAVPNWPDPGSNGVFDKTKLTPQQLGAGASTISAAQGACQHLLPSGGRTASQGQLQQERAQALQFSRCIRAHGVPNFPDPDSTGRIPERWPGVDQGSPTFEAANTACAAYRPPYVPSNAAYNAYARTHPNGS